MVMELYRGGSLETVIDRVRVGDVSMDISWAVRRIWLRFRWAKGMA